MASGAASTSVATVRSMSSIPARNEPSPKKPWSTATSKQRPSAASRGCRGGRPGAGGSAERSRRRSRHVDLDVVGDAAEDRVVRPRGLQDRARDELGDGPVRDEARDEALPRDAAAEVAVEPEAAVPRGEN